MKTKICKTVISEAKIHNHLYEEGAINEYTRVIDAEAFTSSSTEMNNHVHENYNTRDDLVFQENGMVQVNPQVMSSIWNRLFPKSPNNVAKIEYEYGTNRALKFKAVEKLRELLPGTSIRMMSIGDIQSEFGARQINSKGFVLGDNEIVINTDTFDVDTPFHEYGHIVMKFLKESNPAIYELLMEKALLHHTAAQVSAANPTLEGNNLGEEIFVNQIGLKSAVHFAKSTSVIKSVKGFFKKYLRKLFNIKVNSFSLNDSIDSIMEAYSEDILHNNAALFNDMSPAQVDNILNRAKPVSNKQIKKQLLAQGFIKKVNGQEIFFDLHREKSDVYYDALKGGNQKKAEEKYIQYMTKFLDIRNSRVNSTVDPKDAIKIIDDIHNNLHQREDSYLDKSSGEVTGRASSFIDKGVNDSGGYVDPVEAKRMAEYSAKAYYRRQFAIEFDNIEKRKAMHPGYKKKKRVILKAESDDYVGKEMANIEGSSDLAGKILEFVNLFDLKTNIGTEMHDMAEEFILLRQLYYDAQFGNVTYKYDKQGKKEKPLRNPKYLKGIEIKIYEKGRINRTFTGSMNTLIGAFATHPRKGKAPSAQQTASRTKYFHELHRELTAFEKKKKGRITYRTERRIGNALMGYSGTSDLVAVEEGTNKLTVIDHKTKERDPMDPNKYKNAWNTQDNANFTGAFSQYVSNAHNKASIQTSLYRLMYEMQGFDVEDDALVFFTDGRLSNNKAEEYINPEVTTIVLHDMRQILIEEFSRQGIDLKKLTQEKNNDIHDSMAAMFDNADPDVFVPSGVTIKRVHSLSKTFTDRTGNDFYGFSYGINKYAYPQQIAVKSTKESIVKKQKEYINSKINNKKILLEEEDEIIGYFNNPDTVTKPYRLEYLKHRLRGITKDTHTVTRISSKGGFGSNYAGIILFKNNITDEHTVMVLNSFQDSDVKIGDGSKLLTGALTADINARRNLSKVKSTQHNMKMMKVMAVLAKLKKSDPDFAIEYVFKAANVGSKKGASVPINFHEYMQDAQYLFSLAAKEGRLKNTAKELLETDKYLRPDTYGANMLIQMRNFFETRPYKVGMFNEAADLIDDAIDNKFQDMSEVAIALVNIRYNDTFSLTSGELRLLDKTIAYTQNVQHAAVNQDIHIVEKMLVTPQNYKSTILQQMQSTMRANKSRALREFTDVIRDNAKHTKEFLGMQNPGRVLTDSKYKNLFRALDVNKPGDFYRLKPVSQMSSAEQKYVKVWKKHMKTALLSNVKNTPETVAKVERFIDEGYVPLIYPGFAKILAGSSNKWETLTKAAIQRTSIGESTEEQWELKFSFNAEFQRETGGVQFSNDRKGKMRIDDNDVASEIPNFEMDLEVILNRVASEASLVKYGKITLAVGESLNKEAAYQAVTMDVKNKEIVDVIDTLVRIGVKGHIAEGAPEQFASATGKLSSYTAIAFSPSSIVMEGVTNAANISKLWIQEALMNRLFGIKQRFGTRDMLKAAKLITTEPKKSKALMLAFGIAEPDPAQLKRFIEISEKGKMFKSDNMFGLQALFLSLAQTEVVIAAMLRDGSWDAYSVDDRGNMKYSIKKDLRMYDSSLRGEDATKQRILRDRIRIDLSKEGKRVDDTNFSMGYTDLELQALKDYVVEAFSSMDDDSKNPATYAFFGKLQGKYRTWILPRVARLMGTSAKGRMSNFNWHYVRDANGKITDVVPQFGIAEGYLYTIGRLANAYTQHMFTDKSIDKMTEFEKAQMSKLFADSAIVIALYSILQLSTCSDEQVKQKTCWYSTYAGKLLRKAIAAAPGDVFIFIALAQAAFGSNSSTMPGLTSLYTSLQNLVYAGILAAEGEEGAAEKLANVFAVSKGMYQAVKLEREKKLGSSD